MRKHSIGALASLSLVMSACNARPSRGNSDVSSPPPNASLPASVSGAVKEASPAAPGASAASLPALPPAPPRTEVAGAAAIVWIADDKVPGGFRSDWIEPQGDGANVRLQRKDAVVAGASQLWSIGFRKVTLSLATCNDPNTQCDPHPELQEPFLRSLKNGRKLMLWRSDFENFTGCDADSSETIEGAVGSVLFTRSWRVENECGAGCPMHQGGFAAIDVDTGGAAKLEFPAEIKALLRQRAAGELDGDSKALCGELDEYRVTASYDDQGELEAEYEFGDNHAGICGSARHCPNPRQVTGWLPKALARWGKLPSWVAKYLAQVHSHHASMIPAERLAAARAEFGEP